MVIHTQPIFSRVLAAFFAVAVSAQPGLAGRDDVRDADIDAAGARTTVDRVGDGAVRGGAELPRGRMGGDGPGVTLMQRAANSIAERTGLTNPDTTTSRTVGNTTVYTDKASGQDIMQVTVNGPNSATVTLLQNTSGREATVGVRVAGVEKTTTVNLSEGSMTFHITPESARENLAQYMTASGSVISANKGNLEALSPGGPRTIDAVDRGPKGADYTMTVSAFKGAPVVSYTVNATAAIHAVAAAPAGDVRGFGPPVAGIDRVVAPEAPAAPVAPAGIRRAEMPASMPVINAPAVTLPRAPAAAPVIDATVRDVPMAPPAAPAPALQPAPMQVQRQPASLPVTPVADVDDILTNVR